MKKSLLILAFAFCGLTSFGQFGVGANFGLTKYPDADASFLTSGAHVMFGGIKDEKIDLRIGFSSGSKKFEYSNTAYAIDGTLGLDPLKYTVSTKFRYSMFTLDGILNFGKGNMEEGAFYGGVGLGFAIGSFNVKMDEIPETYEVSTSAGKSSSSQIYFRGLLGYSFVTKNDLAFYGEGFLNLPPNANGDGEAVEINLYGSLGLQFGIRKQF